MQPLEPSEFCGSSCLGPWLEDLHRPPGPPSPPGSWGAAGRGGAGGGLTVVPIYAPPYPSPSFFLVLGRLELASSQSPSLPGEGQGEGLHCSPYLRPSPTSPPREPGLRPQHAGVELPHAGGTFRHAGKVMAGGGGRAPLSSLQIRFAPLPPPPSLGGWRQQPARAV